MKYMLVFAMALLLVTGCSKKQSEVDQLEKELLGQSDTTGEYDSTLAENDSAVAGQMNAEAVPEEESSYHPSPDLGEGYTVQVAGCESEDYANYLVDLYTNRGYEPYITEYDFDGQRYYRVRIGQFEGITEASNLKLEIEDKYSITVWVDNL